MVASHLKQLLRQTLPFRCVRMRVYMYAHIHSLSLFKTEEKEQGRKQERAREGGREGVNKKKRSTIMGLIPSLVILYVIFNFQVVLKCICIPLPVQSIRDAHDVRYS